ncbi:MULTISPECIES: hypothetical protein [unclassified Sphingomonas]|nr:MULTISPECIES: hypothetical protein [unclassified Sphingomonas]
MEHVSQLSEPKAAYTTPSVKDYGAVVDLVSFSGSGSFDDGGGATYAS